VNSRLELVVEPAGAQVPDTFVAVVTTMFNVVTELLIDRGLEVPQTRVVATTEMLAAIVRKGELLGLPPDPRLGLERVGGMVAGKCLQSTDGRAGIILSFDEIHGEDPFGHILSGVLVGHELSHLVYGAVRNAEVVPAPDSFLPWDVAEVTALLAAEEYRVDALAHAMAQAVFNPTDANGDRIEIASILGPMWWDALPGALDAIWPALPDKVWENRCHATPLDELWNAVGSASAGIAVCLAHVEANTLEENLAIEGVEHPAAELLEPLWRPLFAHLQGSPVLPEAGAWEDDRRQLRDIGLTGFTEVWRRLGLSARPEGETFYLSVDEPPWSPTTGGSER